MLRMISSHLAVVPDPLTRGSFYRHGGVIPLAVAALRSDAALKLLGKLYGM